MTNQNDSNPHKWELWAKGKKPSMKRRSNSHDYTSRGIYMITIATEGRRPILGKIAELPHSTDENPIAEVVLTPFGDKVKDCWFNIPQYHPMVKPLKLCIMPDHIHGLLFPACPVYCGITAVNRTKPAPNRRATQPRCAVGNRLQRPHTTRKRPAGKNE